MRRIARIAIAALAVGVAGGISPSPAAAAPSAEIAKKCMRYSYVAYPYKRPGAVRMSSDRGDYFRDCMARNADVPDPHQPKD